MPKIEELLSAHNATIREIINDAANAYKGVIPDDRWKEPYMSAEELADEIGAAFDSTDRSKTACYSASEVFST
jgi:hypothetical protein